MGTSCYSKIPLFHLSAFSLPFSPVAAVGGITGGGSDQGFLTHQTASEGKGQEAGGPAGCGAAVISAQVPANSNAERNKADEGQCPRGDYEAQKDKCNPVKKFLPLRIHVIRTELNRQVLQVKCPHTVLEKATLARSKYGKAREERGPLCSLHQS